MMAKTLLLGVLAGVAMVGAVDNADGGSIKKTGVNGAGSGFNLRITEIQSPEMMGWPDVKGSFFWDLPAYLAGIRADVFSAKISGGSQIIFECTRRPGNQANRACQAYVFMYSCSPCQAADGGNLPGRLLGEGWERVPCQGRFSFAKNSRRHDFHIFRKEVLVDQQVSIQINNDLDYAFFALDKDSKTCKGQTAATCASSDFAAHCAWNGSADECRPVTCPKPTGHKPTGPHLPRCSYCVDHDPFKP